MKQPSASQHSAAETIVNSRAMHSAITSANDKWALGDLLARDLATHGVSVIRGTDPSSAVDLLRVAHLLGTTDLEIDPEMSGPLVMDIRYDDSKTVAGQRPSYFSRDRFPVHTDMSYVPTPPRFLLTQCVRPGHGGEGAALIADCSAAWAALPLPSRAILSEKLFAFGYPPNCTEGHTEPLAVFAVTNGSPRWRFRPDTMTYPPSAIEAVSNFQNALDAATVKHRFLVGDLLVLDNTRVAHGRTAFSGSRGNGRHLRRAYADDREQAMG
jgi:alpha-ketoglutarate-dependent taurine dioxygenase